MIYARMSNLEIDIALVRPKMVGNTPVRVWVAGSDGCLEKNGLGTHFVENLGKHSISK